MNVERKSASVTILGNISQDPESPVLVISTLIFLETKRPRNLHSPQRAVGTENRPLEIDR